MSNDYQIGLTSGTLVNLTDDPYPVRTETERVGFTLSGSPINVAMQVITWEWTNTSQEAWDQIISFWKDNIEAANPPPYIYIRSIREDGSTFTYAVWRCKMGRPSSSVERTLA